MKATADFSAHINGADYALKKGEEFEGTAAAAAILAANGFLTEGRKATKKEASDGNQS